ncbi:MAG: major capsid protein [Desulfobaccales bacterium]
MIHISESQMERLLGMNRAISGPFEPGAYRPFIGSDGKTYVTIKDGVNRPMINSAGATYMAFEPNGKLKTVMAGPDVYATLRRDEWKQLDETVLETAHIHLVGIQDLINAGLTVNIPSLGTTEFESHTMSESMEAGVSMDPAVRTRKDRPEYGAVYTPMPLIHSDFSIGKRPLEASRKGTGSDLQVDSVAQATRVVSERLERMLFADETYKFGRGLVYSYTNHPDRTQKVLVESWLTADPGDILDDVLGMVQASLESRHYGPWTLYIPAAYTIVMDRDYVLLEQGKMLIRDRLMKVEGIKDIKAAPFLADDNILLVSMESSTVRLLHGLSPTVLQWTLNGGFTNEFAVVACMIPQIRSDHYGRSGIVHAATL